MFTDTSFLAMNIEKTYLLPNNPYIGSRVNFPRFMKIMSKNGKTSNSLKIIRKPNLVSLNHFHLQIMDKFQMQPFSAYRVLVKSLINKSCHNSRISNKICIKFEFPFKLIMN